MRLKENQTNYHASSVRRRTLRQSLPSDGPPRPVRGKKDRRRWCGGHVGREHKPKCVAYAEVKHPAYASVGISRDWKLLVCETCGKELDFYMPWRSPERREAPPEWVTT